MKIKTGIFLLMLFFVFSVNSNAQYYSDQAYTSPLGLSLQAGVAVPFGDFDEAAGLGLGGELTFEYLLSNNLGLNAVIGYYDFGSKEDLGPGNDFSFSALPILIGGRYIFSTGGFRPYLGAQLGLYMLSSEVTIDDNTFDESETKFGFAPLAGLRFHFPPNLDMDLGFKYNVISTDETSTQFLNVILGARITL